MPEDSVKIDAPMKISETHVRIPTTPSTIDLSLDELIAQRDKFVAQFEGVKENIRKIEEYIGQAKALGCKTKSEISDKKLGDILK